MHLLIPYASTGDPDCQALLPSLKLDNLRRLLALFPLLYVDDGSETSFSPPHERAHARALTGIDKPPRPDDGRFPWATWHMLQQAQHEDRTGAWAFITLCHWDVASNHISMRDPAELNIGEAESRALMAAMQPYFAEDGITLRYDSPGRWLASGEIFRGLLTASLDRVIGQPVDAWMPEAAQAKPLRRLQNEMQMLLYTHPVNDQRAASGLPAINTFWISGTGRESALLGAPLHSSLFSSFDHEAQTQYVPAAPEDHWHDPLPGSPDLPPTLEALTVHIPQGLREAARHHNWKAWADHWHEIDRTYCAQLLRVARDTETPTPTRPLPQLTLCGERHAITYQAVPYTPWGRFAKLIRARLHRHPLHILLEQL